MGDTRKVIVNGEEFEVELEQDGENWTATIAGETFEIKVPDAGPAPKQKRASGGKSKKSGKVSANIPGKVVTVEVSVGDVVEEGQVVMILEAMKMHQRNSSTCCRNCHRNSLRRRTINRSKCSIAGNYTSRNRGRVMKNYNH